MKFRAIITSSFVVLSNLYCDLVYAADSAAPVFQQAIPFKPDKGAMAGVGTSIVVFLLLFAGIAWLLFYLKKQQILKIGEIYKDDAIKVVGVKRLSTKTTAFVIEANGHEVLIVQNNNKTSLLQLNKKQE